MTTTTSRTRASSQADLAYEVVRDLLIRLVLPPGEPIGEADLMERTGFGRTPLREALNRLEAERLVNIFPRRGTFATDINLADLALITDLREDLEAHAASRAAQRATDRERAMFEELAGEIRHDDPEALMSLDTRIHRAIHAAAHNHFLAATAGQYLALSTRIWWLFVDRLADIDSHIDEHRDLLEAIVGGDADRAGALARMHVRSFESAVRELF